MSAKSERHQKIIELITEGPITRQEELNAALQGCWNFDHAINSIKRY